MPEITYKQANRRYQRAFVAVILIYCLFCIGGPFLLAAMEAPSKLLFALVAAATAAPLLIVFGLIARFLKETDEYTRLIQTQALLAGGFITLSLAAIWGFLELFQVVPRARFFPSIMMVAPVFFAAWGLAYLLQHLARK